MKEIEKNFPNIEVIQYTETVVGTIEGRDVTKEFKRFFKDELKEQKKLIDLQWEDKIKQVIGKISGSEYEEKQVWRELKEQLKNK